MKLKAVLVSTCAICVVAGAGYFIWLNSKVLQSDIAFIDANLIEVRAAAAGIVQEVNVERGLLLSAGQQLFQIRNTHSSYDLVENQMLINQERFKQQNLKQSIDDLTSSLVLLKQKQILTKNAFTIKESNHKKALELGKTGYLSDIEYNGYAYHRVSEEVLMNQVLIEIQALEQEFNKQQRALELSTAVVKDLEKIRMVLEERSDDLTLRTELVGKVAEVYVHAGEYVKEGELMAVVSPAKDVYVAAYFDEKYLQYLSPGGKAKCSFESIGENDFSCVISKIGSVGGTKRGATPLSLTSGYIVKTAQRIPVELVLTENMRQSLTPGLTANVTIEKPDSR
jgi:multidrug resistance efflux pump